ncbi:MAG: MFS transporter [Rubrivivax sp.]
MASTLDPRDPAAPALWQSWPAWVWGLLLASCTVVLDFFVVLACLPTIAATLGASLAQLQLVLGAYAIANAALLIVGGGLGDVLGRQRTLRAGLVLFAAASVGCATAADPATLILFRAAQGAAGALMQPQVLGLLSVSVPAASRTRAFDLYAASMGFAAVAAQLIGGGLVAWLAPDTGWRACFWLSVPLCLGSAWLVRGLAEPSPAGAGVRGPGSRIDLVGACMLGALLACMCSALTLGREQGWPDWSLGALFMAAGLGAALVGWQVRGGRLGQTRIIPAGVLTHHRFWLALLTIGVFYAGVASLYFVVALELRDKAGLSPLGVALVLCVMAASFVTASSSRRVKARVGAWWAESGLAALAAGHVVMWAASSLTGVAPPPQLALYAAAVFLQGLGIGLLMGPLVGTSLAKVPPQFASVGGGMASTLQQIGNSLGIAGIGLAYLSDAGQPGSTGGAVVYLLLLLTAVLALRWVARRGERGAM